MAIGAASRLYENDFERKLVAIGDGKQVDNKYPDLRRHLKFLASQRDVDNGVAVTWYISYQAFRPYHDHAAMRAQWCARHPWRHRFMGAPRPTSLINHLGKYVFNESHRAIPAPLVLDALEEETVLEWSKKPFIVIEPNTKFEASPSKRWPIERYAEVARRLSKEVAVYQLGATESAVLAGVKRLHTPRFRDALPFLKAAKLYIGPEGGLHHASAAMGTRAVVICGGYSPPAITGYDFHVNLTGGSTACGTHKGVCIHCVDAMNRISVDEVVGQARRLLALCSG